MTRKNPAKMSQSMESISFPGRHCGKIRDCWYSIPAISAEADTRKGIFMSKTNQDNLEERFDAGEDVLDYFETGTVLTIQRLAELAGILNLSALAREAGINVQTLQAKIRRQTPLSGAESRSIVEVLKRHHLTTMA